MSTSPILIDLHEHCWQLSRALAELCQHDPVTLQSGGESWEFGDAAAWLNLASGVSKVEVDTARFDESVMWCGTAARFEDARSGLYSRIAAELTVFMFAWGAFETVAKIVDPPSIPAGERTSGANGLVDRVLYQLRDETPLQEYVATLRELDGLVHAGPEFLKFVRQGLPPAHIGASGVGLDMVRRVRNGFAHGSTNLPLPENGGKGWCGNTSPLPAVIGASTRIVLLTIQMLLASYYSGYNFDLHILEDENGFTIDADVHVVLRELHRVAAGEAI